jgi:hypothetical protein
MRDPRGFPALFVPNYERYQRFTNLGKMPTSMNFAMFCLCVAYIEALAGGLNQFSAPYHEWVAAVLYCSFFKATL